MKLLQEFKTFAIRGNAVDMLIGVVVGVGFSNLVNSFVKQVLNPPLGLITGSIRLSEQFFILRGATETSEALVVNYGLFITSLMDFIIIAFVVFLVVKGINVWREESATVETPEKATKNCKYCFSIISKRAIRCPHCTANNP
ncbi:MAG: large conductance mechanosensitive channel protein MscL [Candidatus Paceibacterota bacterium]